MTQNEMTQNGMAQSEMVNHPPHYTGHPKKIECIDVIEESTCFNLATAMKYLWRVMFGSKDSDITDLRKCAWYLDREIERRIAAATRNATRNGTRNGIQ